MNRSVVVGVNGSPESFTAAAWAAEEAQRRGLPLRLLHASEALGDEPPGSARLPELSEPLRRSLRMLQEAEEHLAATCPAVTVRVDRIVRDPRDALQAAAGEAELLVLGSSGLGTVAGYMLGSVALAVITRARCPVVLVRAGGEAVGTADGNARVVLGLDPRHPCEPLLAFAFDAASRRSARLDVVHSWSVPVSYGSAPDFAVPESESELEGRVLGDLATALAPWRAKWPAVQVAVRTVRGRPGYHLTHAAADAALAIVGRRTRHATVGARLGPVAHAVIHHARCPVAVVPHE